MRRRQPSVLVVDRAGEHPRELIAFLRKHGFDVAWSRDAESAFNVLDRARVECMISVFRAPRIDGLAVLDRALTIHPQICAVMISGGSEGERPGEAMRRGAWDCQARPLDRDRLLAVFERGQATQRLAERATELEARLDRRFGGEFLDGRSFAIRRVMEQTRHVAATRSPVLIEGEPGTGKARVAQAIHHNGARRDRRFVWAECTSAAEGELELEIFGEESPAISGDEPRRGLLEIADGGSLLLEEITAVPPAVQVRLLRFLNDRVFERIGSRETLRADVRLLVTTRRSLAAEVRAGRFRKDLGERLGTVRVQMPSLSDRREDIPFLVHALLGEIRQSRARRITGVTRGAIEQLIQYPWPGNMDELRSTLERMAIGVDGSRALDLSDLPDSLRERSPDDGRIGIGVGMTLEGAERALIAATLRHTGNDKPRAAAMLGMGLRTLYRKLKLYSPRARQAPPRPNRSGG